MPIVLPYRLRRLSSRFHRLRLALHARGWRGMVDRVLAGSPHGAALPTTTSAARPQASQPRNAAADGGRVLVIDVTTPRPDRDSGSMRAVRLLDLLATLGPQVDFLPDDGRHADHYTDALSARAIRSHHIAGERAQARWLAGHAPRYHTIIISRYHLAEALIPLLRRVAPRARLILDTVDLHHLREQREAERHGDARLARLAAVTRRRELATIAAADVTWVVSPVEQALLVRAVPQAVVQVVPNLHDPVEDVPGPEGRRGLLFVGGAAHPPNVDAVRWLLDAILPEIRRALPDVELHLVGEGFERLVTTPPPGVRVHGHVVDLAPLLRSVRVGLAPLRFGAGVKGKVNLGMSHGIPMVVTGCAAEGLHAVDSEHLLLAETATDFAAAVVTACTDDNVWRRLSRASRDLTGRHFTTTAARDAVLASLPVPVQVS